MCNRFLILCVLITGLTSACGPVYKGKPNLQPLSLEEMSQGLQQEEAAPPSKYAFLGVAHRLIDTAELKQAGVSHGYRVDWIVPDSAADKTGLQAEDIIFEFDGINLDSVAELERKVYLSQYIRLRKKIGDHLYLKVLRPVSMIKVKEDGVTEYLESKKKLQSLIDKQALDKRLSLTIDNKILILHFDIILGDKKNLTQQDLPLNEELFPQYAKMITPHETLMNRLIDQYDLRDQYQDTIWRYSEDELWDDGFRLDLFRYLHRAPFKLVPVIEDKTNRIEALSRDNSFKEILLEGADLLDVSISPDRVTWTGESSAQSYLDYIVKIVDSAWEFRQEAFAQLSQEEVLYLEEQLVLLFDRFSQSYYIDRPGESEDRDNNRKIIELAQKVDFTSLFQSGAMLVELTDRQFLFGLQKALSERDQSSVAPVQGVDGSVLVSLASKAGAVLIGGTGRNIYKVPAAVIIDLGGDDLYIGEATVGHGSQTISAILDLSGKDEYLATEPFAQGSGFLGIGLLFDLAGDDLYVGTRFSQGSTVLGIGMLGDFAGNDRYYGEEFNQGTAFWGAAILLDVTGNDYYQSNLFAQGVGGVKGFGALLDNEGDDFYFAGGRNKSSYNTSGIFQGSSQGLGIGFRGYTSGGIGLLLDGGGDDSFWAGNFSQGTGYFFGIGIIRNFGTGNDTYTASRYGQGASAHSAAGILIDDEGNDRYGGYHIALQAAAWDLGIAAFVDKEGNDTYNGSNGFSQAAAAHNGMAFFIDDQGFDQYFGDQARPGNNDYHGGSSLSFFIDSGGELDNYSSGQNNSISLHGEYGIRADLQEAVHDAKQ